MFMDQRSMYYLNYFVLRSFCYLYVILKVAIPKDALRYRLEGRRFDSRCCHWSFSLT